MTTINLLVNHGIPTGWTDALPWNNLTNQQPHGFHTHIAVPGEELDSADSYTGPDDAPVVTTATVVPECVHIHKSQLPADEQPGAENALLLEGEWVYKVFAGAGSFSQDTYAWVRAPADGVLDISVPVQVHYNPKPGGDGSPGAAVWRLRIDENIGPWFTFGRMFADREWDQDGTTVDVTAGQVITIRLQLESRSEAGIDFFTDLEAWRADFTPDDPDDPEPLTPSECRGAPRGQYARVVNVYPADATRARKALIGAIARERGNQTVTGSYDDAGIGDLDEKTAVLWDIPEGDWPKFRTFYERDYPGTVVVFDDQGGDPPVEPDPEPEPEPEPVDYEVVVNLLPQDATKAEKAYVLDLVHESRETILQSADDAARLVVPGIDESRVKAWDAHRWPDDEYALEDWLKTRGVGLVEYWYLPGDEPSPDPQPVPDPDPPPDPEADPPLDPEPDLPPDPTWSPHNYVPTGTKLGFHAAGDGGQTGDVFAPLTPLGAQPPTSKVIVSLGAARDIKAIDPSVKTIGRIIDAPGYGNVEGFDYGGDPEGQAHWHMAAIMQAFGPHLEWYDYIEVINEQGPPSPAYHVKLAQFFLHCMTIANTWGMKLALFSHSTGIPEPEDWDAIADTGIFEAVAQWGHCISLHEYNLNGIGGCLYRYRDLYERIILPKQLDIPLYITEYNVDVADAGNADVMFANWTAYDAELARDPYVAGVHIYSTGEVYSSYRPTIYSLWDRYRAYAISVKDRVNG